MRIKPISLMLAVAFVVQFGTLPSMAASTDHNSSAQSPSELVVGSAQNTPSDHELMSMGLKRRHSQPQVIRTESSSSSTQIMPAQVIRAGECPRTVTSPAVVDSCSTVVQPCPTVITQPAVAETVVCPRRRSFLGPLLGLLLLGGIATAIAVPLAVGGGGGGGRNAAFLRQQQLLFLSRSTP